MKINNRWKIILVAASFNLLFELSLRGGAFFLANPALPLFIFPVYFTWFTLIEDLIGRFKLKDYHFALLALIFPYTQQLLFQMPDAYGYMPPLFLGINWQQFIWLSLVWYIALQTLMAFYLGNRLFPRNNWKPLLSKKMWAMVLFLYLLISLLFKLDSSSPPFQNIGTLVVAVIDVVLLFLLYKTWPDRGVKPPKIQKSPVMDILSAVTVAIFIFFALTVHIDPTRLAANLVDYSTTHFQIIIIWTTVVAVIMYVYRLISRRPISV